MPGPLAHRFNHVAVVLRGARVPDGHGGWTDSYSVVNHALICRVTDSRLERRIDDAGRLVSDVVRTLYAFAGEDVKQGDKIEIGGNAYTVEDAADQADGAYRKAHLLAEHPQP